MKKILILSSFLFLLFTAKSQMIIVDVGPWTSEFTGGENVNSTKVITYSPDGTHSSLDMTNVPNSPIESIAFVTAHLNSIISQGYKLIKIQDYQSVNNNSGDGIIADDFPLERTVYYFAVP
tara:strand:+ start:1341 stop:1703 length:363 start_codon:yes stop_codon:yes gene_type:complete